MTHDEDLDPVIAAALAAAEEAVFPPEHPGQVRTLADDGTATLAGAAALTAAASSLQLEYFTIYERLGRGSTGEVYRARDDRTDRIVAVKFMRAGTEKDALRLEGEARMLVRCTHPNIVHVHQVATQSEARVVLVMEYIAGTTLDVWLSAHHDPREILRLLIEVGRALEAAHNVGVIHRDIQPTNVMVDARGRARLIDFGLANVERPANGPLPTVPTHVSPIVGTYEYIAPEHHHGAGCTSRSDQFSFCALLYRSLYGQPPPALPVTQLPAHPRLPSHVRAALLRGLNVEPAARWPAMDHLLQELARPWWKKRRVLYTVAVPLIFLLGIACVHVLRAQFDREPEIDQCAQQLSTRIQHVESMAALFGIRPEIELMFGKPAKECSDAVNAGDNARIAELTRCLDVLGEAIEGFKDLRRDDPDVARPRINHSWGQQRAPLPLLARCAVDPVLSSTENIHRSHVRLVQLRLLLQHQQYAAARDLLTGTSLLADLADLGAHAARAEVWIHAAQIARRYAQQGNPVTIHGLDVDLLLDLAEGASLDASDELQYFVRLERIHRSIDRKHHDAARSMLRSLMQSDPPSSELAARLLQAHARLIAVDDPLGAAELIQRIFVAAQNDARLSSILVELQGLRALYRAKVDPKHAHAIYEDAIALAKQSRGPRDHLLGVIAANAMQNAFAVDDIVRGELWANIALTAFDSPFGSRSIIIETVSYHTARNLLLAGESQRGMTYSDRALGYARKLGLMQEIPFVLNLRNVLEMRSGRLEAARRTAKEAREAMPDDMVTDPKLRNLFDIASLTAEAEENDSPELLPQIQAKYEDLKLHPNTADEQEQREIRYLLARALTQHRRLSEAVTILDEIVTLNLGASTDPLTHADIRMLKANIEESQGNYTNARHEACAAIRQYKNLRSDGQIRLDSLTRSKPHLPSLKLLRDCPEPPQL